jgi:MoaA/NifB/PqqE/SkfB family radical SAM enzyme
MYRGSAHPRHSRPFSDYFRVLPVLAFRTLAQRFRTVLGLATRPRSITITITRRCNSRCIMCNIWRLGRQQEELSLAVITRFLSHPLFSQLVELDLTGGEPLLRQDLPELVRYIANLKDSTLLSLRTVALASNGLLPEVAARGVGDILEAIQGKFDLALVCSLDGLGAVHDRVRGVPGAYHKVRETIQRLQKIKERNPNFWLGIKTTILPVNWDEIPGLREFAREQGLFHILSPVLFTPERFRNLASRDRLDVLPAFGEALIDLYSEESLRHFYYSYVLVDTLTRGRRRVPCTAASDHFFIEGDGTIFPCPLLNLPLGHLQTHALDDILASPQRQEIARKVGRLPACANCLEPGCIRFSQASDGTGFLKFILQENTGIRFRTAYVSEGLAKYF